MNRMEIEKDMLVVNRQDNTFGIVVEKKGNEECVVECLDPHGRVTLSPAQLAPIRKLKGPFLEMPLEEILKKFKWEIIARSFKK
ncbi:hypothetical protein KJA14_02620 [Patescibacteria group bacterium]|nr:hypothetical protein [Patescibacteria group bacterium]